MATEENTSSINGTTNHVLKEQQQELEKLLHTVWFGNEINSKVIVGLQSALRLQKDAKIILWTEDHNIENYKNQLKPIQKKFICIKRYFHSKLVVEFSDIL